MSDDTPRSGGPASGGPEHDAWLREALRHAPDAGAAPPPSLRDAILAEARAATRASATRGDAKAAPTLVDRVLAFWSWLARPQVAAGFASVMAATLVGMLWWDRPIDETLLPPPAAPAATTARPPAPDPAPAAVEPQAVAPSGKAKTAPAAPAAKATGPADRLQDSTRAMRDATTARPLPSGDAAERSPESERRPSATPGADLARQPEAAAKLAGKPAEPKTERKDDDRREKSLSPAETVAPATGLAAPASAGRLPSAQAPSPFPARPTGDADSSARSGAPAPVTAPPPAVVAAPAPVPAAAPWPAPAAPSPAKTQAPSEPFALAKKAEQGEKEGAATTSQATPAASPGSRQRAALAAPAQPMAALLAALASEEGRWTRLGAGTEAAPVDAATRTWLAQVQTATAARWQPASERDARGGNVAAAPSPASVVRLERGDGSGATLRVEDGGVRFEPATGSAWFAPLPADVVARLRASLPALAR